MRTRTLFQTLAETAWQPRDVASLIFFRVAFGLILLWEVARFFVNGLIDSVYLEPRFHFTYLGFGWVRPLPDVWLTLHFLLLGVAALMLALGWWTRPAAAGLSIGWAYVLLMEKAAYLNHLYLICLLAGLLIFVPTHRAFSLDAFRHPKQRSEFVPAVALWALRAQVAIPYIYGAIAKLNGDWLHGQPLQMWMSRMTHVKQVLPMFGEPWLPLVFSWGGFLLDLLVVPLLLWQRTRAWAFGVAVVFHLLNALMFRIGIFPWMMICATTLFFDPDWPRRIWRRLRGSLGIETAFLGRFDDGQERPSLQTSAGAHGSKLSRRLVAFGLSVWFLIQLTVPFRHLLYPGDVDWTEEGSRFAWRMMLVDKAAAMRIFVIEKRTQRIAQVDPAPYLTRWQLNYLSYDPDLLVQFSQFLAREFRESQGADVEVRIQDVVSLNGRRPQFLVDPDIDLASQTRSLRPQPWVVPLHEPLAAKPWDQPPATWAKSLQLPDPMLPPRK